MSFFPKLVSNNYLLAFALMLQLVYCQSGASTRVLGIGIGTLIIIIAVIFSVIWCLACRSSSHPEIYSIIGLLVPVILILAFVFTPKQSQRVTTTATETDANFIPHIIFMVLSVLGFLILGLFLLFSSVFRYKKAKNVARAAFTMRED